MEIFAGPPISFSLDRKSHLASDLKRLISDQLRRHFIANYTDDVLAEYITVLVSNGKNQNQARDDLDAFLGERTADFVSWLWDLLLKLEHRSEISASKKQQDQMSASPRDSKEDQNVQLRRKADLHKVTTIHLGNPEVEEENTKSSNDACKYMKTVSHEGFRLVTVRDVASMAVVNTTECRHVHKNSLSDAHLSPRAEGSSKVKAFEKLKNEKSEALPDRSSYLPRRNLALRSAYSPSDISHPIQCGVDAVERTDSLAPIATSSCQGGRIRLSVWDRLGMPVGNIPSTDMNLTVNEVEISEKVVDQHPSGKSSLYNEIGKTTNFNNGVQPYADARGKDDDTKLLGPTLVKKIERKRHIDEVIMGHDGSIGSKSVESFYTGVAQGDRKQVSTAEVPQAIDSQVQSVKLRLRQIETEISKLREKQVEKENVGSCNSASKSGSQKPPQEDIQSRSVLVTNVHFVATREALSLFFGKCGQIVGVFIVSEDGSFFPKRPRSACITFASKESADKALQLSGMPFYSKTIKVTRLAENALASLPAPVGEKPAQSRLSQIKSGMIPDLKYRPNSHHQWRRESDGSALSVPSGGSDNDAKGATTSAFLQQMSVVPTAALMKWHSAEQHQ